MGLDLDKALYEYGKSDYYPFHMPGHKRRFCPETMNNPYLVDITEIDGFDNLHHAEGILLDAQRRASEVYGAMESFYLVNGSTAGILSAVSAAVPRGGTLLMARNCHKAAYHAAYLRQLQLAYLVPEAEQNLGLNGGISPEKVKEMLKKHPETKAVLITSPTYDGVVSDVEEIARTVHAYDIPLIVDEAHGAHFAFSEYFPVSALALGADVVIQSLHKTLPCMTQTAVLHRNSSRVSAELLRRFLGIYQSSSPSYVFMAGIDACMRWLEQEGKKRFEEYTARLQDFREKMRGLRNIRLLSPEDVQGQGDVFSLDLSKLLITGAGNLDGSKLSCILLDKYHLQMEMAAPGYALALSSVMDTEEGFRRLGDALFEIDNAISRSGEGQERIASARWNPPPGLPLPAAAVSEAMESPWEAIPLMESGGRISAEFLYLYPPGSPCLVPGEYITEELLQNVREWEQMGLDIQGPDDYNLKRIRVMKEQRK